MMDKRALWLCCVLVLCCLPVSLQEPGDKCVGSKRRDDGVLEKGKCTRVVLMDSCPEPTHPVHSTDCSKEVLQVESAGGGRQEFVERCCAGEPEDEPDDDPSTPNPTRSHTKKSSKHSRHTKPEKEKEKAKEKEKEKKKRDKKKEEEKPSEKVSKRSGEGKGKKEKEPKLDKSKDQRIELEKRIEKDEEKPKVSLGLEERMKQQDRELAMQREQEKQYVDLHKDRPKKLLIVDGNDDERRMQQYHDWVGQRMSLVQYVQLQGYSFAHLRSQVQGSFPIVVFTHHGLNTEAGLAPSVSVRGYRNLDNMYLGRVKTYTDPATQLKARRTEGVGFLPDTEFSSTLTPRSALRARMASHTSQAMYNVNFLQHLWDLVRDWPSPPVIVLFVCNSLEKGKAVPDIKPISPSRNTGITVFFPRVGCPSSRWDNSDLFKEVLTQLERTDAQLKSMVSAHASEILGFLEADISELVAPSPAGK